MTSLALLLVACTTDDGGLADTDLTSERTLDNCGGTVSADVPEPYATWFLCADVAVVDGYLNVYSSNLPPHPSPYYPTDSDNYVEFDTRTGEWHQNPNTIAAQELLLSIPLEPTAKGITVTEALVDVEAGTSEEEFRTDWQGVTVDGTALFAGVAAPGDDIMEEEYTFDVYEGHPQNTGVYHHHGTNPAAVAVAEAVGEPDVEFYGLMCDGTVVLGCDEPDGTAVDAADLDAQSGHVATLVGPDGTTWFTDRYHAHACDDFGRTLAPEIAYYSDGC